MNNNFYRVLKPCQSFNQVFEIKNYTEIPEDWLIIATDVLGSTKAIEEGRYKEVNTIGASTIICVLNATSHESICYQFGGDGALIAAPYVYKSEIEKSLNYLKKVAEKQFKLSLRVGMWKKENFTEHGFDFKVLKFPVNSQQYISMFAGSGVPVADEWLKVKSLAANLFKESDLGEQNRDYIEGLECRWSPVHNQRGQMVTGIIKTQSVENNQALEKIFHLLHSFGQKNDIKPVSLKKLPPFGSTRQYLKEWKAKTYGQSFIKSAFLFLKIQFKLLMLAPFVFFKKNSIVYLKELEEQTDFQKYDGLYRFVLDLSSMELEILQDLCEKLYQDHQIYYGLHTSQDALMTCMFFSFNDHFHFIDGGGGGYAMAARQLKEQIKARN